MTYYDYNLKFSDANECNETLFDGDTPLYSAIDVIGTIYKPTGEMLIVEGEDPVPEMEAVQGYHVNVRHEKEAPELQKFAVTPNTPIRTWF